MVSLLLIKTSSLLDAVNHANVDSLVHIGAELSTAAGTALLFRRRAGRKPAWGFPRRGSMPWSANTPRRPGSPSPVSACMGPSISLGVITVPSYSCGAVLPVDSAVVLWQVSQVEVTDFT